MTEDWIKQQEGATLEELKGIGPTSGPAGVHNSGPNESPGSSVGVGEKGGSLPNLDGSWNSITKERHE